jgi:HlyD family secretion protein
MKTWILPGLASAGIGFALWSSLHATPEPTPSNPPVAATLPQRIAATGVVETLGEETALAPLRSGTVSAVMVTVGQRVTAGTPLIQLDDREALAALTVAQAQVTVAKAQAAASQATLQALTQRPRIEELRPAEAVVAEAVARSKEAAERLVRGEALAGVFSNEDIEARRQFAQTTAAAANRARLELELLKAGTWGPEIAKAKADVASAEAAVIQAEAGVLQAQIIAERHLVRAPAATTVLRIRTRAGEAAVLGTSVLMTLGDGNAPTVRAQVDERDAARLKDGAKGVAISRGDGSRYPLTWLRTEPLVVPKRTLTGDTSERVDTRVVEVLFRMEAGASLRIGQQVDVELDASR